MLKFSQKFQLNWIHPSKRTAMFITKNPIHISVLIYGNKHVLTRIIYMLGGIKWKKIISMLHFKSLNLGNTFWHGKDD